MKKQMWEIFLNDHFGPAKSYQDQSRTCFFPGFPPLKYSPEIFLSVTLLFSILTFHWWAPFPTPPHTTSSHHSPLTRPRPTIHHSSTSLPPRLHITLTTRLLLTTPSPFPSPANQTIFVANFSMYLGTIKVSSKNKQVKTWAFVFLEFSYQIHYIMYTQREWHTFQYYSPVILKCVSNPLLSGFVAYLDTSKLQD